MANQQFLKLIESRLRGGTVLDLSRSQLASLPPEITKLTFLTGLSLNGNQLTRLPPEISNLTRLTNLDLSSNELQSLPSEVTSLPNLSSLRLSRNRLTDVPSEIANLTSLTTLTLAHNQLSSLPPDITKLTNLTSLDLSYNQIQDMPQEIARLTKLTILDLGFNEFTTMPPEIAALAKLTRLNLVFNGLAQFPLAITDLINLRYLSLGAAETVVLPRVPKLRNRLTFLPPQISRLANLTYLDLNGNQLKSLPPEITELTNLNTLDLSCNQLTSLPPDITKLTNLDTLNLSYNQLTNLPPGITTLTNLAGLDLRGNPLPIPPEALSDTADLKTIFAAIAGLVSGERLNEAKMLVVGDGKVGKSSVVEQLIYGTFNPRRGTTLGVEINDEMQVVQSEVKGEGDVVKLNIWDFGGQEIQHSTHQFFLTTRSLYLLVVDARKGDQISNVEYWLKLIASFGGNSPIVVVINQIDQLRGQRPLNLDRKALQEKYNIRNFVETSCESGQGIPELKGVVALEVDQMKHVRDIWPREWLAIKRRLREMQADYIPVEKYLEICGDENLDDEDIRRSLLGLLHDLGVVIRFPGETEVLNPRWVTQGVYGLLTSEHLVLAKGQFDLKDVDAILGELPDAKRRYPSHTHRRLIDVMEHFELCFEFTDRPGHYLIPRQLHDNEPDIRWDDTDALKFQYHYETLPDSVISRFIVRMNQHISGHDYWKNGVFLQNEDDKNQAKVKADLIDRKIFISVRGKEQTRRAFLAVVRSALDEINSNFKIEIKQLIPVPGFPQVLVSYQNLLAYEESDEREIFIPELRKKFSVGELLDGVEELSIRMKRRDSKEGRFSGRMAEENDAKLQRRILRVVVASPSDVQGERNVLPAVFDEVNKHTAADHGLHLELARWETDSYPGFHLDGPQGLIDQILKITDCDLLIGIFWKHFGTQTPDGRTGTEHEFSLAYETWKEKGTPQILFYFNLKPYTPKSKAEIEQWGQVLEFRDKFPKEALWWPYKGKSEFEKLVRTHLTNYIRSLSK